jgi:hypothetical protein
MGLSNIIMAPGEVSSKSRSRIAGRRLIPHGYHPGTMCFANAASAGEPEIHGKLIEKGKRPGDCGTGK